MKLEELLEGIRPVTAYSPRLAQALGDVKQAVFLCQLIYWTGKGKSRDGWIYKTQQEWTQETALTINEQRTARKALRRLGLLEERRTRIDYRYYYRIDIAQLKRFWADFNNRAKPLAEVENIDLGEPGKYSSLNPELPATKGKNAHFDYKATKTTPKNTSQSLATPVPSLDVTKSEANQDIFHASTLRSEANLYLPYDSTDGHNPFLDEMEEEFSE